MSKKSYTKPIMQLALFVPNEYIAGCWYVPSGHCYDDLVQDKAGAYGRGNPNNWYNPNGIDEVLARNHGTNHRLPTAEGTYYDENDVPIPSTNLNDGNFYDYPALHNYLTVSLYHEKVNTPVHTYDGHYFNYYETNNAS